MKQVLKVLKIIWIYENRGMKKIQVDVSKPLASSSGSIRYQHVSIKVKCDAIKIDTVRPPNNDYT
jgi:hypothetical protein